MKYPVCCIWFFCSFVLLQVCHGQELQSINYRYQYSQNEPFIFQMKRMKGSEHWLIAFRLAPREGEAKSYLIQWHVRTSVADTTGTSIPATAILTDTTAIGEKAGTLRLDRSYDDKLIVARVLNPEQKRVWYYYASLRKDYPGNGYLVTAEGRILFDSYVAPGTSVTVRTLNKETGAHFITHYDTDFPAAVPAFSEGMAAVPSVLSTDTTYRTEPDAPLTFNKPGAYLLQTDTLSPTGLPLLVLENYPKYSQVRYLSGPLIYICTKNEYEKLRNAGDDKKAFDRVVLTIAGNAERARILMRGYFRRVEQANQLFTSYKEGWKTDRGMILIVYGLPEEVFRFKDREVWNYKNANFTGSFEFVRSGTLFDPDNYVLIRNPKYKEKWYEIVDLWRSAQF